MDPDLSPCHRPSCLRLVISSLVFAIGIVSLSCSAKRTSWTHCGCQAKTSMFFVLPPLAILLYKMGPHHSEGFSGGRKLAESDKRSVENAHFIFSTTSTTALTQEMWLRVNTQSPLNPGRLASPGNIYSYFPWSTRAPKP